MDKKFNVIIEKNRDAFYVSNVHSLKVYQTKIIIKLCSEIKAQLYIKSF